MSSGAVNKINKVRVCSSAVNRKLQEGKTGSEEEWKRVMSARLIHICLTKSVLCLSFDI